MIKPKVIGSKKGYCMNNLRGSVISIVTPFKDGAEVRLPLTSVSDENYEKLRKIVVDYQLIAKA